MKKITILLLLVTSSYLLMGQEVKINHNGTNGLAVESDGTLRLDGAARTWDDLRVTLDKGSDAAALDYFRDESGPQVWWFRYNKKTDAMSFTVQLPHNWKEGTRIYPHIHWSPKTDDATASHAVEWHLEYTWVNYNSPSALVFPLIVDVISYSAGPYTAYTHRITDLTTNSGLDAAGKLISSILICRIWRNGNATGDTYPGDAAGLFIDFHYEIDGTGSRETFTK